MWKDFITLAGFSDEWVTAYVGLILASSKDERAVRAATRSWNALRKRSRLRLKKGWGYNRWTPADADSTGLALNLYLKIKANNPRLYQSTIRFLKLHIQPGGGVKTFAFAKKIRMFTRLSNSYTFSGWCNTHPSVTAVLAKLPEFNSASLNYLLNEQATDGGWLSYWWVSREYSTLLAVEAILLSSDDRHEQSINAAIKWSSERVLQLLDQKEIPDLFALANALCILALKKGYSDCIDQLLTRGTQVICKHQLKDGSWSASAKLRIPPPDVVNPDTYHNWVIEGKGGGSILTDRNRIFTTATLLKFLLLLPHRNKLVANDQSN